MSLDSIVNVSIDAQTTSPSRVGFGVPLIVGYHTHWTDTLTRSYSSLLGMVADGFATTDPIYLAARAAFAQNPRPATVLVGRLTTAAVMTLDLTPVVFNSRVYTVTINGVACTYTSDGTATAAEIVDALVIAINASTQAGVVTASNVANVLHIISDAAGTDFTCAIDYAEFARDDNTPDTMDIEAQIIAISLETDAWYCLILVNASQLIITAAAAYVETVKKIAVFVSGDSAILAAGSGDVASAMQTLNYARTAIIFSRLPHEMSHAAWAGEELPNDPGSSTWAFKTLSGITPDTFTETELGRLVAKGCNYYQTIAGVSVTQDGVTASGEYIDVTIFVDWLAARIQERIFSILVNVKKIPFTDSGIALIEAAILAQLREGVNAGGLADDDVLQVIVPAAADVSSANKAARILTPVTFQGTLAGAIHSLVISGTVTV